MKYFFLFAAFLVSFISKGQVSATLTVPKGHKSAVRNSYFTPNDRYIVSTDDDHVLCIWDGDDGRQVFTLRDSLGSFNKIEVDNSTSVVVALSDSGQLYIINFPLLKVTAKEDSVIDFSINKATGTIFFITKKKFSTSINKYETRKSSIEKVPVKNFQGAAKIIALSETSIALQDDMEGAIILNTLTGIVQPVAGNLSNYLIIYDYHPSGFLLCGGQRNSNFTVYNIDIKTNTVKGKIVLTKEVQYVDCAYTSNPDNILITKTEEDDLGIISFEPPAVYSFRTGNEITKLGTEFVGKLTEMNKNLSQKSVIATNTFGNFKYNAYLRYDFLSNTSYTIYEQKRTEEGYMVFACANNSKKIAVFSRNFLLPAIYSTGIINDNSSVGMKNYGHLTIDISKNVDKTRKDRFEFLLSDELIINDSLRLAVTDTFDTNTNLYTGILYRRNTNAITDSIRFQFYKLITPLLNSDKLFWSADSVFYVLNLSTLKIADSVAIPGIKILSLTKLGENIQIDGSAAFASQTYKYDIIQKKLTRIESPGFKLFSKPYQEEYYTRSVSGYDFRSGSMNDYDYLNGIVSSYPLYTGNPDTVAVLDTNGEVTAYSVVVAETGVAFSSLDTAETKSRYLSDKIENLPVLQVRYWSNSCYIIMTKQTIRLFLCKRYSAKKN